MIKQVKQQYGGITKDFAKSQAPGTNYFDAMYGRTTATDNESEFAFSNEKGTRLDLELPDIIVTKDNIIYGNYSIPAKIKVPITTYYNTKRCGDVTTTKGLVLFTQSISENGDELSCIFLYSDNYLSLLYANNLGFNYNNYITAVCNYETEKIEKIYWVDGIHQLRFLNINHSIANGDNEEIYDIPSNMLNAVAPFKMSQPVIKEITSGGNHTAGMIQYTYNLYKVNGSQTSIAPFTDLIPLKKTNSGGDVNDLVETLPVIEILNIDDTFDNIKVYSIKYTSLNQEPTIKIVLDSKIPDDNSIIIYDDNSQDNHISIDDFMFLGSNIYIPSDICVKNNRLFIANYHEKNMTVDLDMRAFQFDKDRESKTYHNLKTLTSWEKELIITDSFPKNNNDKFDTINLDFDKYQYKNNGVTRGGSGRLCEFQLTATSRITLNSQFFKDNEIYRLGIVFYNEYGKTCEPLWICDFKSPDGNLRGAYNNISFNFTDEFYTEVEKIKDNYSKPVGYKLLIADRSAKDSSIVASGILTSGMINYKGSARPDFNNANERLELSKREPKMPNFLVRNVNSESIVDDAFMTKSYPLRGMVNNRLMSIPRQGNSVAEIIRDYSEIVVGGKFGGRTWQYNNLLQMYSPEILFNNGVAIPNNSKLRIKSSFMNTYNAVWGKEISVDNGDAVTDVRGYDGITPKFAKYVEVDNGEVNNIFDTALIEHPGGSDPNRYQRALWYRQYGTRPYNENTGSGSGDGKSRIVFGIGGTRPITDNPEGRITVEIYPEGGTSLLMKYGHKDITKVVYHVTDVITKMENQNLKYSITVDGMYSRDNNEYDTSLVDFSHNREDINGDFHMSNVHTQTITDAVSINRTQYSTFNIFIENKSDERLVGRAEIKINVKVYKGDTLFTEYDASAGSGEIDIQQGVDDNIEYRYIETSKSKETFNILGTPEFTTIGQTFKNYSNLGEYRYTNTLLSFKADGRKGWKEGGTFGRRIVSINANNNNCITLIPDRYNYEDLYRHLNFKLNAAIMYGELVRSSEDIYLGGLYGGNKYEQKLRTRYREIGNYYLLDPINPNKINNVSSPGDVFIQVFKFLRIAKHDDKIDQGTYQMEEIVEFPCESTINLSCRNDESTMEWDSKLFYEDNNYHKYNQVYSQKNSIKVHQASEYYVKDNNIFGSTVIPSKQKNAGELIDNWLNILPNDALSLDGQYGNIQKLVSFNDEVYAFQNKAIAHLSITPRVQVPTEDGIGLHLGTGDVLPNYKYVTQSSGTYNKHSIVKSPFGVYYFDDLNASINVFNGQIAPLSETAGLHSHIQKYPLKELKNATPRINTGVVSGYDPINKDIYVSFNFKNYTDTWVYNEKRNMFVSRQDDYVSDYIMYNDQLLGSQTGVKLYRYGSGDYNVYYDKTKPTTITFTVNPEIDSDTIINNLEFKSEVYKEGIDQPLNTITHVRVYNEYQDTGKVPIVVGRRGNARRFFRDWNVQAPRNKNTRQRVRNPWNYVELTFENSNNLELILHDIIISYSI